MFIDRTDAFMEAQFESTVHDTFGHLKLDDGAPAADVLVRAILLDRRHAGVNAEQLKTLSIDVLIDAYSSLSWILFNVTDGGEMTLPFGSKHARSSSK